MEEYRSKNLTKKEVGEIRTEIIRRAHQARQNHGAGAHVQFGYDSKAEGLEEADTIIANYLHKKFVSKG